MGEATEAERGDDGNSCGHPCGEGERAPALEDLALPPDVVRLVEADFPRIGPQGEHRGTDEGVVLVPPLGPGGVGGLIHG